MAHTEHDDQHTVVVDLVDHAVIAHADAPRVVFALELLDSCGSRVDAEACDGFDDAQPGTAVEPLQVTCRPTRELDAVRHRWNDAVRSSSAMRSPSSSAFASR